MSFLETMACTVSSSSSFSSFSSSSSSSFLLFILLLCPLLSISLELGTPDITLVTERAYTLSSYQHQLITSSALGWASIKDVQSGLIKPEQVVLVGDSAVCRIRDGDEIIPGRTDLSGGCIATARREEKYQVLVTLASLAHLSWVPWDMFSRAQIGTVAYNDGTFVGSLTLDDGEEIIGELDFKRGMSGDIQAWVADKLVTKTGGRALVETEPIKYRLEEVVLRREREKVSRTEVILGTRLLKREKEEDEEVEEEEWKEVVSPLDYKWDSYIHWGQVIGTVRSLPASAVLRTENGTGNGNKETFRFRWGLQQTGREQGKIGLTSSLLPGTGSNSSVTGSLVTRETPYTAILVSVYRDGSLRRHNVSSVLVRTTLESLQQTNSPPVYLDSGLPSPTTTTLPSPTSPPTTSPSPSTQTPPPPHIPTPTPTLFPPAPPPLTKPNPLRQFYPEYVEEGEVTLGTLSDGVQVAMISSGRISQTDSFLITLTVYALVSRYL